ncbi:unnamed protein product [Caenorhabditis brenneri]
MSLLSKKTKNLVESSKITAEMFQVEVSDTFRIELWFLPIHSRIHFKLYHVRENQPLQEVGTPGSARIHCETSKVTWANPMSVEQLIDHLKCIFHSQITTLFFNANFERFCLKSIHKNVKDFKSIYISSGNHEHNKRVLSLFQPASLVLVGRALVRQRIPRNVLIQNFDVFHVPSVRMALNELLMANSRVINLACHRFSSKLVNQFLHLWVKGSNPRLDFLSLEFFGNFLNEELFKGLKYEAAPRRKLRRFNNCAEKKIKKVVGGWDIWRFGISLLSKKIKNLVESTKITTWNLQVEVTDNFKINLLFPYHSTLKFKLNQVLENEPLQELDSPGNYQIAHESKWVTWTNTMSVKELLDHLKFIFHSYLATLSFGDNCERFSLESIHKNVKDFRNIYLLSGNHEHNRKLLGLFQPTSLMIGSDALVNLSIPKDSLIQIFNVIHFVPNLRISLDELLMANSRVIDFVCRDLSVKIINRFLKLWVKGSNPRLECLLLWLVPNFRTEELFEGLNYTNVPCNTERLFNSSGEKKIEKLVGGYDIWRCDGTRATIILHRFQFAISLLSKKTKGLVESLKLTPSTFNIVVKSYLLIMLSFQNYGSIYFDLYRAHPNGPLQDLETPGNILIRCKNPQRWTNSLSVKQLLDHLKLIFHSPITTLYFEENCERFSLEAVHKNVKDFNKIYLASGDHEHNKRILSLLQPSSLTLDYPALVNECVPPRHILIQNFNVMYIPHSFITLDELLMTNSREIELGYVRFSAKTINKILKLWMNGCNPRLEWMLLLFETNHGIEELLRGLSYTIAPWYRQRLLKSSGEAKTREVTGGYDISRFDVVCLARSLYCELRQLLILMF